MPLRHRFSALVIASLLVGVTVPAARAGTSGPVPAAGQWALTADRLDARAAWTLSQGSGQTVAVVDTGVDARAEDLRSNLVPGADFTGTGGNGETDDSVDSHGTAVASIVAARPAGPGGLAGLAPRAHVLPIRVTTTSSTVEPIAVAEGIAYATAHGADVISISLATPVDNPQLRAAVQQALARGIFVVAAAGNAGRQGDPVLYPAAIPGVVAVGGSARDGASWPDSETGPQVTLAAPAEAVLAATRLGGRVAVDGTSFATPFVAAALALVRARFPDESRAQQLTRLTSTARPLASPVPNDVGGFGEIRPAAALRAPTPPVGTTDPTRVDRAPSSPSNRSTASGDDAGFPWLPVVGGILAAVLLGGAGAVWRRRRHS